MNRILPKHIRKAGTDECVKILYGVGICTLMRHRCGAPFYDCFSWQLSPAILKKQSINMKKILVLTSLLYQFATAQKASLLHEKAIVVDTHNDVLSQVTLKGLSMEADLTGKAHSDIARWKKGGVDVQIFSIFCDERFGKGTAFAEALKEIDSLDAIVARNPKKMMLVNNSMELMQAVKQKKLACMKGVEGGHMIEDQIVLLDSLYKRGTRYLTLTWNNSTSWASSAADETQNTLPPGQPKGLNDLGQQIVHRMNELGMLVDLSHVGEQTFWDVMRIVNKPVLVSHSCVYQLCGHRRNLKDDQIKAIAKNGGVIHLNFYTGFLDSTYEKNKQAFQQQHLAEVDSLKALKKPGYEIDEWLAGKYPQAANELRAPMSLLFDHIDYIVKLIGVNHVGLGSDFDGIESPPKGLDGVQDFPKVTEGLQQRGYTASDIQKILGGNFLRLLKANENKAPVTKTKKKNS
jgi:membrane dipeptidase